ncbi:hypothetical protein BpHYR1_033657 [Brachionus plicatilis]|uniref:Uncharacterized protein n=1 Tax=Brachionus plicatilis TaxID=10195 RepID=A0A3M7RH59_BRAPC|nr:hypothetical protein BpHYR1_033657 [Brachionus plicatilis]
MSLNFQNQQKALLILTFNIFQTLALNGILLSSGLVDSEFDSQFASVLSCKLESPVLFFGLLCCLSLSISKSSSLWQPEAFAEICPIELRTRHILHSCTSAGKLSDLAGTDWLANDFSKGGGVVVCASQSSIASFQETPTSIHKGTKRKDFNFLTKKKFDFITTIHLKNGA